MTGPALQELIDRLARYNLPVDATEIATFVLELIREKSESELAEWIGQLAIDLLHKQQGH